MPMVAWIEITLEVFNLLLRIIYEVLKPCFKSEISKKVVLITGAANGIGKELARQYGYLGATIICVDIDEEKNSKEVKNLNAQGVKAYAYSCDVAERNAILELAMKVADDVGQVDILINNAGVLYCKSLINSSEKEIRTTFGVNILSHFWSAQAFLPSMIKRGGHVVAISSAAGLEGIGNASAYSASKFAIHGLMESLAAESKEGRWNIHFTTICPFFVDTGMCAQQKIRFPSIFGELKTKDAAAAIILAQRRRRSVVSIPWYIHPGITMAKTLPRSASSAIYDFLGIGIGSEKVNLEIIQDTVIAVLDAIVLLVRVLYAILEATYKLVQPSPDANVSTEIILITGSAQGIGRELATQYGKLGATIICVDVNKDLNEKTVSELKKLGVKATAYSCDVTNRDEVFNLQTKIKKEVGDVSILVNNAGIMPCKRFQDHTQQDIERVFNINLIAHFWMLQAFLPAMMDKNKGHIVALSSIAGLEGYPNVVPYNATKFGVRGLMEGLSEEFRLEGRAIKFTTICPFMVDTGLCKKPKIRFDSLLGMLQPEEVASIIIKAQRQGKREISIPGYVRPFTFFLKLLPVAANEAFHDFMNTGLEVSDL